MKKLTNTLLILLGTFMLLFYMWFRFIRVRLPREIPFSLSELGFIILLYICFIYFFILYTLLIGYNNNSNILKYIKEFIYQPLITLDTYIKTHKNIEIYFRTVFIKLLNIIETLNYLKVYFFMEIIPRIILLLILLVDIFYFQAIYYFYKGVYLLLLLLLNKYILYSFKALMEKTIDKIDITTKIYCYDLDKKMPRTIEEMYILSIKDFTDKKTYCTINNLNIFDYIITFNSEYVISEKKRLGLAKNQAINIKHFINLSTSYINFVLSVNKILYSYSEIKNKYKYLTIIIMLMYLLCWSYILFVSFHTLPVNSFTWLWEIQNLEEPFSNLNLDNNKCLNL